MAMAPASFLCPSSSSSSSSSFPFAPPWLPSRKLFLCSANPSRRPPDDEPTIRPQVAPSVLRSLRSVANPNPNPNPSPSPSPNPNPNPNPSPSLDRDGGHEDSPGQNPTSDGSPLLATGRHPEDRILLADSKPNADLSSIPSPNAGESLIERNLRKRAAAMEKKKTEKEMMEEEEEKEKKTDSIGSGWDSSTLQDAVATSHGGSLLSPDLSPLQSELEKPENCPISTVFWEEKPPDLSLEGFYNLDFHIKAYRLALASSLLLLSEGKLSPASLLWFAITPDMAESIASAWKQMFAQSSDEASRVDDLLARWKGNAAEELSRSINEKDVVEAAVEDFSSVWESETWKKRVLSGEAMALVSSVILSTEIDILLEASDDAKGIVGIKRRLESSSAGLSGALMQLHGPPLDPIDLWEKALKDTPLAFTGDAFLHNHALILSCKRRRDLPLDVGRELSDVLRSVQDRLDGDGDGDHRHHRQYSGLVAMLRNPSSPPLFQGQDPEQEFYLLIAPWYWVLPMVSSELMPISIILTVFSCIATSCFPSASAGIEFAWEPYAVPLGWLAIVASMYIADKKNLPWVIPFWNLGAIGKDSFRSRDFPSRASYLNALAESAFAPIATSLLLAALGVALWGPSRHSLETVFALHGYVLVPPGLFSHSSVFSELLQASSVAMVRSEDENLSLAVSPFVLAGLLGLNFTAFSLFPGPHSDGAEILRNLIGNQKLADGIVFVSSAMLGAVLFSHNPLLGLSWIAFSAASRSTSFVRDDVSEPSFVTQIVAFTLVVGAMACFVPFPH